MYVSLNRGWTKIVCKLNKDYYTIIIDGKKFMDKEYYAQTKKTKKVTMYKITKID